ncbi:MAG: hypothetical protein AB8B56_07340 [Crocinitomicaceae bacterium]
MKKVLLGIALTASAFSFAQNNTDWYLSTPNSTPSGYIGIGTNTLTVPLNTPLPSYNLHVHGVSSYTSSGNVSSLNPGDPPIGTLKNNINYGVTSRIGLTNSMTGQTDMEGAVLQMSQMNFSIKNQSNGDLLLSVPSLRLTMSNSNGRAWLGNNMTSNSSTYGKLNVISSDNGLYIQTNNNTKYGLRVKVPQNTCNAFEVFGSSSADRNFSVTGAGYVFARKYTTTLSPIPDYVFSSTYDLMPLSDLRTYIQANHHLPNIPSAKELSSEPVDLGELERLLLEKVEELTLYVLELEQEINNLKEQ